MLPKTNFTLLFGVESWITQFFGYTEFAKTHYKSGWHTGIDLVPEDRQDWTLHAPMEGMVTHIGNDAHAGINLALYNGQLGLLMRFWHLGAATVSKGDYIPLGKVFGKAGNTGNSTGKHLHLETLPVSKDMEIAFPGNGTHGRVDPLGILRVLGVHI